MSLKKPKSEALSVSSSQFDSRSSLMMSDTGKTPKQTQKPQTYSEALTFRLENSSAYKLWLSRVAGPSSVQVKGQDLKNSDVSQLYFNTDCRSAACKFPRQLLDELYAKHRFRLSNFDPSAQITCPMCKCDITMGGFWSCQLFRDHAKAGVGTQGFVVGKRYATVKRVSAAEAGAPGDSEEDESNRDPDESAAPNPFFAEPSNPQRMQTNPGTFAPGEESGTQIDPDLSLGGPREGDQDPQSGSETESRSEDESDGEVSGEDEFSGYRGIIEFKGDVPDVRLYNELGVEEYVYILNKGVSREKYFKIDSGKLSFDLRQPPGITVEQFTRVTKSQNFGTDDFYDIVLFEYWRLTHVKIKKRELPVYYFRLMNEEGKRLEIDAVDVASQNLRRDDIATNETVLIVLRARKIMNLYLYDYNQEVLTYMSCDRKEHLEDAYAEMVLNKKYELFDKFNEAFFKREKLQVKETTHKEIMIENNLSKRVFVHYHIAKDYLELDQRQMDNFFDVIMWILCQLNLRSKEELAALQRELDGDTREQIDGDEPSQKSLLPQRAPMPQLDPDEIKNFQNFYSMLWYYYYYDKKRYIQLMKAYEKKFASFVVQSAGMDPKLLDEDVNALPPTEESMSSMSKTSSTITKEKTPLTKKSSNRQGYPKDEPDQVDNVSINVNNTAGATPRTNNDVGQLPTIQRTRSGMANSGRSGKVTPRRVNMVMENLPPLQASRRTVEQPAPTPIRVQNKPEDEIQRIFREADENVRRAHQSNLYNYPELYKDQFKEEVPFIPNKAIVDKDLRVITKDDLSEFEASGNMSKQLFDFFINYIREKQSSQDQNLLQRYNLRAFFFNTDFYGLFINDLNKKFFVTKYERVRHMTKAYSKVRETVFDRFQKIVIPVIEILNTEETYKLVVIDCLKKSITLYDPLKGISRKDASPEIPRDNKHLIAISNWIEQEYYDKAQQEADVYNSWLFVDGDSTNTDNPAHSALFVSYYIYTILKGIKLPFFRGKELNEFIAKITQTLRKKMAGFGGKLA